MDLMDSCNDRVEWGGQRLAAPWQHLFICLSCLIVTAVAMVWPWVSDQYALPVRTAVQWLAAVQLSSDASLFTTAYGTEHGLTFCEYTWQGSDTDRCPRLLTV